MRGRPKAILVLTEAERGELLALARRRKTAQAAALRARIVLACADGMDNNAVAEQLRVSKQAVSKWRGRYVDDPVPSGQVLQAPEFVMRWVEKNQ